MSLENYLAFTTNNAQIFHGNNLEVLPFMADNSVDAIVTDPPYEIGLMGKKWDNSGIAYSVELWRECLRVLKPGGHLLSFGGTRTWHRVAVAIEDAGFEIRDSMAWLYGSGFPKSLNIGKSIEAKLTTGSAAKNGFHKLEGERTGEGKIGMYASVAEQGFRSHNPEQLGSFNLEATTPEAKKWSGWGTALKPAFEPIVMARKPLDKGMTVAENVLTHGVGGLNIDASRISYVSEKDKFEGQSSRNTSSKGFQSYTEGDSDNFNRVDRSFIQGRWPANILLDEHTAELLDEQSGMLKSGAMKSGTKAADLTTNSMGAWTNRTLTTEFQANEGGASRFFYVAKASKRDRNEGLDNLEAQRHSDRIADDKVGGDNPRNRTNQAKQNFHPTVKPTALMRYLIKLVTPPGGTVLDPFTGSGSTGKAAILEGYQFIGIELTDDYLPIIKGRLEHAEQTETIF